MYVCLLYVIGRTWSCFPEPGHHLSVTICDDLIGPVGEMGRFSDESSRWCFKIRLFLCITNTFLVQCPCYYITKICPHRFGLTSSI